MRALMSDANPMARICPEGAISRSPNHAEGSNHRATWRGTLAMNEDKNPQSEEDFNTRLQRARGNNGNDGRGGVSVDSQTGKGMAFRIGIEIVVAVTVAGGIGFLIDNWLDTKPWFLVIFLLLGNAAGLWNVFRVTTNQGYAAGFESSKRRDIEKSKGPEDG